MASSAELTAMRAAIALSRAPGVPLGPNPRVGAVILDVSGDVVAAGRHRGAGTPHAEVDALATAGPRARGGVAVVTLEPCSHAGRTGPCTSALVHAGVRRVVFAQADTSPVARGGSLSLRAAGVDVEGGALTSEAARTNVAWTFAQERGRPYVTWKFATSLDGRSAAADGSSQWITGPEARADVHLLRAECDAVLVGTGTALAEDPRLTVRGVPGEPVQAWDQPLRAVMGCRDLPADARVLDSSAASVTLKTREPGVALAVLRERGCRHVWLEGGPTLAAAFVRAGLVDRVVCYVAPALLGSGAAAVGDLGIASIEQAARLCLTDVTRFGDDVRLTMTMTPATTEHDFTDPPTSPTASLEATR
ncbi:MAG: bifunctional diaminohydroxyphosphoribosylaminopyrimidine deaminase/5-amino-6-(5-phosphoribosylamino)uracil reductase RibD [Lapillicoccus sp.]